MLGLCQYCRLENISCERIKVDDINETVDLINKEYSYQDKYRNKNRIDAKELIEMAEDNEFYIFEFNGVIIACVYIEFKSNTKVYFGLLTVSSEYKGKGIGKEISKSVEAYAKDLGKKELLLAYMHIEPWLKQYYEDLGFKKNGVIWEWDGIKLINMSKKLN